MANPYLLATVVLVVLLQVAFGEDNPLTTNWCMCSIEGQACSVTSEHCAEGHTPRCGAFAACLCTCTANEDTTDEDVHLSVQQDSGYELVVGVTSKAAELLEAEGYNLVVYKGYVSDGKESFNAAWQVIENSILRVESTITLGWEEFNKGAYVGSVAMFDAILSQETKKSDPFQGGQEVDFYNTGWKDPIPAKGLDAPYFRVRYKVIKNPLHLTLLAPNKEGSYSPYFYDELAMGEDATAEGYASMNLYVQLSRTIEAGTYTGKTYLEGTLVAYQDESMKQVCITASTENKLLVELGACENEDTQVQLS